MHHGLPRKIRIAFVVQMALASLAILLAFYVVTTLFKYSFIQATLKDEARHYWELHQASPVQPPPNTYTLRGYLVEAGYSNLSVPAQLRPLPPGFHDLVDAGQLVWVDRQPAGTLYLVYLREQATRVALWFAVLPAMLALFAIYGATWLTYRASKRLVSPVAWLARVVSRWDPRHPDISVLAPERLPPDMQGEARQLAGALYTLGERVEAQIEREHAFTRDTSHELRTPLTVIRLASDMALQEPDLSPRVQRSLRRIQDSGREMEAVIDAFLILARDVDVEPQREWFDVCERVQAEAASARILLGDKPVRLDVQADARPQLYAPPRVLQVVVGNLLRNACSYTDRGRILVTVEADAVVVEDTGIGMAPEALARAFEPFYRAVPERPTGTGLGLSIVRRLCDRFGWTVELDSTPGRGTRAAVRFPAPEWLPPPSSGDAD